MSNMYDQPTIQVSLTPYTLGSIQLGGASQRPRFDKLVANIPLWNQIFVISCVIAVSLDPLFFYIPFIDEDNKCLGMDKKLRVVALVLRSLLDITFIVHIICQIRQAFKTANSKLQTTRNSGWESKAKAVALNLSWRSVVTDVLALLPIPQVLLVKVFFKMRGSGYLDNRKILSFLLLAQYLPRIYRIHLSSKKLTQTGLWAKGAFNFFLYILASHVLGAYWYFFSIQRETSCWHRACVKHNIESCMNNFYCDDDPTTTPRNTLFREEFCPINFPPNATPPFDFGIFLDSLQSGNTATLDFPMKFFYSFWWGLRNLSNFGTNLTTSTYVWENFFAILISIIGLLLFLYLIGNVQTFMQLATTKSEETRQKIIKIEQAIEEWMVKNDLPEDMKNEIKNNIRQQLEENIDAADLENLFSILPWNTRKSLKRFLCMSTLRKVPMLKGMDEKVLKMICDYLKPVMYAENSVVVRMGQQLDRMLFITEGSIWTYMPGGMPTNSVKTKGEFYGEELLKWASSSSPKLPISTQNVQCHTKVEGFVLMSTDLTSVVSKCQLWWNTNDSHQGQGQGQGQPATAAGGAENSTPRIRYIMHPH
ncbi:unnamed protein product [Prunus brigantina]